MGCIDKSKSDSFAVADNAGRLNTFPTLYGKVLCIGAPGLAIKKEPVEQVLASLVGSMLSEHH